MSNEKKHLEIIIGIVAPLGVARNEFIKKLKKSLGKLECQVEMIGITENIIGIEQESNFPKSLIYFLKMQIFNDERDKNGAGYFAGKVIELIQKKRNEKTDKKIMVYIVDQLKNTAEYEVLSFVYGLNYVQISLFSNETERDKSLRNKLSNDGSSDGYENISITLENNRKIEANNIAEYLKQYKNEILPDASHRLIEKDFKDSSCEYEENRTGQQVSKLFHMSHYFFNLDSNKTYISDEIDKLVNLLSGKYQDYPTQDEFGMCLAYHASVRSNFPGKRHIGAAIFSPEGEVISIASVRAPSQLSNPTLDAQLSVEDGYHHYYKKIKEWQKLLEEKYTNENSDSSEVLKFKEISNFIKDTLDFHPCTHAEVAAIIDAAKLGVSVRGSTMYTTTFPCHLCAKEIINAHIERVVYLEAYPKSKNKELYPNLIDFDPKNKTNLISFEFFSGVGPKRYSYVYSLKNKPESDPLLPPLIKFECAKYYEEKEKDIVNCINDVDARHLRELIGKKSK